MADWMFGGRVALIIVQSCATYYTARMEFFLLENTDGGSVLVINPNRKMLIVGAMMFLSMLCVTHLIVFPNPSVLVLCINMIVMAVTVLTTKCIKHNVSLNK